MVDDVDDDPPHETFQNKGRFLTHVRDGWCVREVTNRDGDQVFRMFYGAVRPGQRLPEYVTAHKEAGEWVEFEDFGDAVRWVEARRK